MARPPVGGLQPLPSIGAGGRGTSWTMVLGDALANEDYCYVRTTGRVTGKLHEVEIWFAGQGDTIYILAGGRERSDWVKNVRKTPRVPVRIGERTFDGTARIVAGGDEDARARRMVAEKYGARGFTDLGEWERHSLPVAIDLT